VIVVEHDEDAIRLADYVVDVGPAPASMAAISCQGTPADVMHNPNSLTGIPHGELSVEIPTQREPSPHHQGDHARGNN